MVRINLGEKIMKISSVKGCGVVAIGVSVVLFGCGRQEIVEKAPVVRAVKVVTVGGDSAQSRAFPGMVEASDQVDLSFRVGGPLIEFPVLEGDFVIKGQMAARIDPRDYRIRLDAARAEVERAEADFRRYSALYEKDAVSKAQLDQALAARDVARAEEEDATANLDDTSLRAPFSGRIAETFVENFQDVTAREPILSLISVTQVKIVVDIPENLVASFEATQRESRFVARFDAAPGQEFAARPSEVATQADPRTQSFRVTFTLRQPEGINVLPGMTATVVRYPPPGESIEIVVPAVAIFADETGSSHVWIVDRATGAVERRSVRTGRLSDTDSIVVLEGLVLGEDVAVSAVSRIRDGMTVRPIEEVSGL